MRIFNYYHNFLKILFIIIFMLLTVVVAYQFFSRNVGFLPSFSATEELSRWMFIWVIFIGAAMGVRENSHFIIDLFSKRSFLNRYLDFLSIFILIAVALLLLIIGYKFMLSGAMRTSPITGLSFVYSYAALPFSGISMLIFAIEKIIMFRNSGSDGSKDDATSTPHIAEEGS